MHFRQVTLMVEKLEESIEFYETIIEMTISRRIKRFIVFSAVEQSRDYGRRSSLTWLKRLVKMRGKVPNRMMS